VSENSELETDGNLAKVLELQKPKQEDPAEVAHRAIDQCLLNMVFQPIAEMKSGKIFAYEALCRSRVPQFETPPALIEAATKAGRIGELGRLQRRLASKNCPDWPLFLNISPNEFDEGWLVRPDDAIFSHRKPVYIEITESVPLVFFEQCHSVLAELRKKGARLAIDDLGAGYSNLKYIADLRPDIVKLDRDMVAGCSTEGSQFDLLCSIAKLCREVNAKVVAEGVETAEELEAVGAAGIEYCQGFLLGRPKITPSPLSWPASELVTSDSFQVRRAERAAEQCEDTPEGTERRLSELENARSLLERSVRKARGEVVRLRKAVGRAETRSEEATSRLTEVERALAESESERRRLESLLESKRASAPVAPPAPVERSSAEEQVVEQATAAPTPARRWSLNRLSSHALLWFAGLLAAVALYRLVPLSEERTAETPADRIATVSESVVDTPAALGYEAVEVATPVAEIESLVRGWASAWSAQDAEAYLAYYSGNFETADGLGGEEWRDKRRERLAAPAFIDVTVEEIEVRSLPEGSIEALFWQTYSSSVFTDRVRKRQLFVRQGEEWRIVREAAVEPAS
jgi:EAL domain-containing protein (putative c-di-GMP-specific phosphodiesterase class I)